MTASPLPAVDPAPPRLLSPGSRGALALISAGIGMHAFNDLAIAASLPIALEDLGGLRRLPLLYALYFVAVVAGGLTSAQLRALVGARVLGLGACAAFLAGLGLMAGAGSPAPFLAGRALQGLSDGLIVALCYGLIPELFRQSLLPRVFAVESVVWATAAVLGPLLGGLATEGAGWRVAMLVAAPLAVLFLLCAAAVLEGSRGAPARKLAALLPAGLCLAGAAAIALSPLLPGGALLALPLGLALAALAFRLDGRLAAPFFPGGAFRSGAVGRGTWLILLMPVGHAASQVYLAFALREIWGLSPILVGFIIVTLALSWSGTAFVIGQLRSRAVFEAILRHAPAAQVAGALCIAGALASGTLPLLIAGQVLVGMAFGMSWGPAMQAIMAATPAGERSRTSSFMPSIQTAGSALGAGLAGLVAGATQLVGEVQAGTPAPAVLWLWGSTAAIALLALLAARGMRIGEADGE
ncbi:MFS transporter [Pseudoroseicyclus tamaricis]|uniref:MFS transporter n=1 Tax=Pseudoroseicyclus tamaricis TaxID=2705421 RepID=A0A6B2JR19_9RHOB|nr:MFS transporter [Pseudoroseicyclus tamaricis]NDV00435.1 MFS transporter [Pseudoroseicyclus tamaricis]